MAKTKRQFWVALIEDDAGMREATAALLRAAGFRTHGYRSAEVFLRSARARTAGCLLVDFRLPGMSGLQLHCKLRDTGTNVPAILITAEDDPDSRLRNEALGAGMRAVLRKPFSGDDLVRLVEQAEGRSPPPI